MDAVLRAAVVYFVLLILFRIAGRRTLSEMTAFDFVLLLMIGEATQQALLGEDFSVTNAALIIATLLFIDVMVSLIKARSKLFEKIVDGAPTIIVENGRPLHDRMRKARVDEEDVMEAARRLQGIERMDQIKYAVLEVSGGITVIPRKEP
ncbi:DUF421 domain-containing protein [Microvirga makkahensis]|uniref:DUF421 domain-containing protein n=1 Tax=Microvirga makkahensis TaxID=1128670 RepID=A0A7X3MX42_9HYPH|nr:YetF domain-containing protein [Microvirga makkahensis]MXQ14832.1 DUF421 domain-containing protein [Microvirga makkahensis]